MTTCYCGHEKALHRPMVGAEERYPLSCGGPPRDPKWAGECLCLDYEEVTP